MAIPELTIVPQYDTEPLPDESWGITDLESMDWALARICDMEREMEENEMLAKASIGRIELKTEILNERAQKAVDFFRSRVASYAQEHRAELVGGGKKKSRTLLHGFVGWRKGGGNLEVKDKEALLEWARAQPIETNFLRVKEEPAIDEIKRAFGQTGEIPPGCDVTPQVEELTIKAVLGGLNE